MKKVYKIIYPKKIIWKINLIKTKFWNNWWWKTKLQKVQIKQFIFEIQQILDIKSKEKIMVQEKHYFIISMFLESVSLGEGCEIQFNKKKKFGLFLALFQACFLDA